MSRAPEYVRDEIFSGADLDESRFLPLLRDVSTFAEPTVTGRGPGQISIAPATIQQVCSLPYTSKGETSLRRKQRGLTCEQKQQKLHIVGLNLFKEVSTTRATCSLDALRGSSCRWRCASSMECSTWSVGHPGRT